MQASPPERLFLVSAIQSRFESGGGAESARLPRFGRRAWRCGIKSRQRLSVRRQAEKNSSALFRILVPTSTHKDPLEGITKEGLDAAEAAIESAIAPLSKSNCTPLLAAEFANAAAMLRHACRLGRNERSDELDHIITEHKRLWLARNRPGGLADSTARLTESPALLSSFIIHHS
jgi:hypothetical protein